MSRLLISDRYPNGHDLGTILEAIRAEVMRGSGRIAHDGRPETRHVLGHVLDSNMKVLDLLGEARNAIDAVFGLPAPKQPVPARSSAPVHDGLNRRRLG